MADVLYSASGKIIAAYGREIPVDNTVRLNRDGTGPRSIPDEVPVMPTGFPLGQWWITGVYARDRETHPHLYPYFISTTATQRDAEWEVDAHGVFVRPTGRWVWDVGYGIHYSDLDFTVGCIRVINEDDMRWLAGQVEDELAELRKLNPREARISMEAVA